MGEKTGFEDRISLKIIFREFQAGDIAGMARIHVDGWRQAYAHFIPAEALAGMSYEKDERGFQEWLRNPESKTFGFVAEESGEIVGFTLAGPNEGDPPGYDGEVYKLFVREGFQSRGIGKLLLTKAVRGLRERGYRRVAIWAFAEGRSTQFYRKLGGEVVQKTQVTIGGKEIEVEIFGWDVGCLEEILRDNQGIVTYDIGFDLLRTDFGSDAPAPRTMGKRGGLEA